jgi:predicted ATPase/serine phosphatase RsbU (regulator of sigma subunit)
VAAGESATEGKSEMMLVSGYSGIGKSALVREIYKPVTGQRGYFISGKFDQFQRNIPYSAVIQAFQELVRQLLTESEAQIKEWRDKLQAALGQQGQVIVGVIPEVELIVGKQPEVPDLGPAESLNRFNLVFQNFIKVFTQPSHPLAIFLDDLQWADSPSLQLIQLLMAGAEPGLFLIGAYRDNEVSPAHPLMLAIAEIQKAGAIVNHISLTPLDLQNVNQLIADTLKIPPSKTLPLAELVRAKTQGNPFFLTEFLKSLYGERLLEFDLNRGEWRWELGKIQARGFTDNVVELMAGKIQKLPEQTQQLLQLAACIGNQFDLQTLALVAEKSPRETVAGLHSAVAEGLVFPLSEEYKSVALEVSPVADGVRIEYKFAHDRIQQAAYSLIPAERKQAAHRQVGQLLLQNTPPEKLELKIFDIVNQLNSSTELITRQAARQAESRGEFTREISGKQIEPVNPLLLAQLNLMAGQKAVASAAYQPAFNYLKTGIGLLGAESWQAQYELTLALYVDACEAAYLCADFQQMEQLASAVLQRAKTVLDKVKVYEVKMQACASQNQLREAVITGLEALKLLGVRLPEKPSQLDILRGLVRTKLALAGKRIEDLIDLPPMTDPYKLAAMRTLSKLISAAYLGCPELYPLIAFKHLILSIKYGQSDECAYVCAGYGIILCGTGDIDSGYKFGQLALRITERLKTAEYKAKTLFAVNNFLRHWKEHVREELKLLEAYQSGLETGDIEYAGYAAHQYCFRLFYLGGELAGVEKEMATYREAIGKLKQGTALNYHNIYYQAVLNLIGDGENPCRLTGKAYDEESMLPVHLQANDRVACYNLYFNKTLLCYLFEEHAQALENAIAGEKYLPAVVGSAFVPLFTFYHSLTLLAALPAVSPAEQKRLLQKVRSNQKKMKKWADHGPMNYLHKFYLVEAERCRVAGKDSSASDYYDRAIALAKENEYINEEALAHELAAKFYLAKGKDTIASAYMQNARYCYLRWGATAKIKDLEKRYPQLLQRKSSGTRTGKIPTKISTDPIATGSSASETLDLATVIKASQTIAGEIVLEKLLSKLMAIVIENAGAQKGFLILPDSSQLRIEAAGEVDGQLQVLQSIPVETSQNLPLGMINYVARTQSDVVLSDAAREGIFTADPYIITTAPKSILCGPILNQGKLTGIVYLENNLSTGAFTADRLEVVRILSSQAAISIENALLYRTLEQKVEERTAQLAAANREITVLNERLKAENIRMAAELDVTRQLQQMILPKESELLEITGLDIAGFMEPADEVGGDYYDVLQYGDRVKIGIGDVTGHGLESGVLMIMVQTAVRALLANNETDPVKFLNTVNRTLYDNVTRMNSDKNLSLCLLDYSDGILRLSGQHEETIVVRSGGEVERIDTMDLGFPIGLEPEIADFIAEAPVRLNPGDVVVLYTDGITEAENLEGAQYGQDRLIEVIQRHWQQSAAEIRQAVIDDVRRHIGEQKVYDDITLVAIKQK